MHFFPLGASTGSAPFVARAILSLLSPFDSFANIQLTVSLFDYLYLPLSLCQSLCYNLLCGLGQLSDEPCYNPNNYAPLSILLVLQAQVFPNRFYNTLVHVYIKPCCILVKCVPYYFSFSGDSENEDCI